MANEYSNKKSYGFRSVFYIKKLIAITYPFKKTVTIKKFIKIKIIKLYS